MDTTQTQRRIDAMQQRIDQLAVDPAVNAAELAATYGSLVTRYAASDVDMAADDAAYVVAAHDSVDDDAWTTAEQVLADYAADVALHPDSVMDGADWGRVEESIGQLQDMPLPGDEWYEDLVRYRVALGLHERYDI